MTLTDEQCEKLKYWAEVTPEQFVALIAPEFAAAMDNATVVEKINAALSQSLEPLIGEFEKLAQRIEKLEAALFRRTSV